MRFRLTFLVISLISSLARANSLQPHCRITEAVGGKTEMVPIDPELGKKYVKNVDWGQALIAQNPKQTFKSIDGSTWAIYVNLVQSSFTKNPLIEVSLSKLAPSASDPGLWSASGSLTDVVSLNGIDQRGLSVECASIDIAIPEHKKNF